MKLKQLIFLTTMVCASSSTLAQTCFTQDFSITTPTSRFTITGDVVTDNVTKLVWKRCAYGQVWNGDSVSCTGTAVRVTWQEALNLAVSEESNDLNEWRLPNIKELSSIVEKSCVDPAVNMTVFPNAIAEEFWSSTTSAIRTPSLQYTNAWAIAFYNGRNNQQYKDTNNYIRLVKFAE